MAAAYGIVKNHNGWISIESQLDRGTIVRIYLPAILDAEEGESMADLPLTLYHYKAKVVSVYD